MSRGFRMAPNLNMSFCIVHSIQQKRMQIPNCYCVFPQKTPKKTQLTTVKFNWFYVQWIFVALLHFFMISFFVIPQYSKCNAYYFMYYVIFMLWIQKWIIVISSFDIFLFTGNNRYITIKVTSTCIINCDIILYIIVCIFIYCLIFTATCTCISFVLSLTLSNIVK